MLSKQLPVHLTEHSQWPSFLRQVVIRMESFEALNTATRTALYKLYK
jgi:hypothetical protein